MTGPDAPDITPAPAGRTAEAAPTTADPAALRDAQRVAARISDDEAAADEERTRLSSQPLPHLADGIELAMRLRPDEVVHAMRPVAMLEDSRAPLPSGGTLYVTSRRLVHVGGAEVREVDLTDIAEIAVALERLLLVDLSDGSDLAIEVDQPRLLRVQLAAARAKARGRVE